MSTTQDLDQLLDELRRTSLDYSSGCPPTSSHRTFGHSSRTATSNYGENNTVPYLCRSSSTSGAGYNRSNAFGGSGSKFSNSYMNYRQSAYSSDRHKYGSGSRPPFERNNSYPYATVNQGGGESALLIQNNTGISNNASMRATSPAPKFQTIFRTTLNHRPPSSPKRFNQINVTIDPDSGSAQSSVFGETHYQTTPITETRYHTDSMSATDASLTAYREQKLLEELSSARRELAMLRQASSVMDEPLRTPSTLPIQRRAFQQQETNQQQTMISKRHQTSYQSHHDIQQGLFRPQSRFGLQNSGLYTSTGLPKRAMSSANVTNSQTWNYHHGTLSAAHSPTGVMHSSLGGSRIGNKLGMGEGYSARRERLRSEMEQEERLRQSQYLRQSNTKMNQHVAASSSDVRMQQQQRRQHYHSMSTIQPDRGEAFEQVETITLQPIGKGVQDLHSNMGSMSSLARPQRVTASSMLEGLNRLDKYPNQNHVAPRNNIANVGRQNSATNVSHQMSTNQKAQTSYLPQRRVSGGAMSETGGMTVDSGPRLNSNYNLGPYSETTSRVKTNNLGIQSQNQQQLYAHQTWTQNNAHVVPQGPVSFADVQETAPSWYRLKCSRQEAINLLKHEPAGSFLVRDSTTFKDAYGLAVKSAKHSAKSAPKSGFAKFMKNILNDLNSDLVRHYLIETVTIPTRGVRIKGFSVEPVFPSLEALIHHHTQQPLALPCTLRLPPLPLQHQAASACPGLSVAGDSDSNTIVQLDVTGNGNRMNVESTPPIINGQFLNKPVPANRNSTSPLSPTAGLFTSDLTSPQPTFSCRCLYLGAAEIDAVVEATGLMQAVDSLIPVEVAMMLATTCDQMGADSPFQYTECQLQVATNEGILLTDLSRKVFFQRHFSGNSFIYAGVDPRDKMFIHPNHSALGFEKPRIFGFIIKKLTGEFMCHVFSEFDANHSADEIVGQINSILSNK